MVSKVTYRLQIPGLENFSSKTKTKIKKEVGTYLVERILRDVGETRSPVTGRKFRKLSDAYRAEKSEVAPGRPNLELSGAMLNSLMFKTKKDGVEVGIFDYRQAQKADNHNKFSDEARNTNVPARKFIPNEDEGERFRPEIRYQVENLIEEFKSEDALKELKSMTAEEIETLNKPMLVEIAASIMKNKVTRSDIASTSKDQLIEILLEEL